jgi:mRNA interferase RelE/StbE
VTYRIDILRSGQKELEGLPAREYERVRDAIWALAENPHPPNSLKLKGRDGFRIRIGKYRMIYEIDDPAKLITILHVGHRKDVYR